MKTSGPWNVIGRQWHAGNTNVHRDDIHDILRKKWNVLVKNILDLTEGMHGLTYIFGEKLVISQLGSNRLSFL